MGGGLNHELRRFATFGDAHAIGCPIVWMLNDTLTLVKPSDDLGLETGALANVNRA
jgi:hypothetical protein